MRIVVLSSVIIIGVLSGCAPNVSPDSYGVGSVGSVNRAVKGVVISARHVNISGTNSGGGALAGGAAGGVAGSALGGGGNPRTNVVGAIGGMAVGAIAGAALEEAATKQMGMEYVVQAENGALLTIVQSDDKQFAEGQKVIVLYGARSRVIPDNSTH